VATVTGYSWSNRLVPVRELIDVTSQWAGLIASVTSWRHVSSV